MRHKHPYILIALQLHKKIKTHKINSPKETDKINIRHLKYIFVVVYLLTQLYTIAHTSYHTSFHNTNNTIATGFNKNNMRNNCNTNKAFGTVNINTLLNKLIHA